MERDIAIRAARRTIDRFFTADGVLKSWPSRKSRHNQLAVLARLSDAFEPSRDYDEGQVNEILKARIAFEDYVLIRRELIDMGMLRRTRDCRRYWRPDSGNGNAPA